VLLASGRFGAFRGALMRGCRTRGSSSQWLPGAGGITKTESMRNHDKELLARDTS